MREVSHGWLGEGPHDSPCELEENFANDFSQAFANNWPIDSFVDSTRDSARSFAMELSGTRDCARGVATCSAKNSTGVARDLARWLTGGPSAHFGRDFASDPAGDFAEGPTGDFVGGCSGDFTGNFAEASMEDSAQDLTGNSGKGVGERGVVRGSRERFHKRYRPRNRLPWRPSG